MNIPKGKNSTKRRTAQTKPSVHSKADKGRKETARRGCQSASQVVITARSLQFPPVPSQLALLLEMPFSNQAHVCVLT